MYEVVRDLTAQTNKNNFRRKAECPRKCQSLYALLLSLWYGRVHSQRGYVSITSRTRHTLYKLGLPTRAGSHHLLLLPLPGEVQHILRVDVVLAIVRRAQSIRHPFSVQSTHLRDARTTLLRQLLDKGSANLTPCQRSCSVLARAQPETYAEYPSGDFQQHSRSYS